MIDTLNDLIKRVADAIDQRFHDMGFEADPRNDPLWHKGVSIEIAKAAIAEVKRGEIRLTKAEWADAILMDFQTENNRTKADEWEAAYAMLFKQLQKVCGGKREYGKVKDIDAEIAIAEGIQKIPTNYSYEEFGTPVLKHLKSLGYLITKIEVQEGGN